MRRDTLAGASAYRNSSILSSNLNSRVTQIAIASNLVLAHVCGILDRGPDPHSGKEGFLIPTHAPEGMQTFPPGNPSSEPPYKGYYSVHRFSKGFPGET